MDVFGMAWGVFSFLLSPEESMVGWLWRNHREEDDEERAIGYMRWGLGGGGDGDFFLSI